MTTATIPSAREVSVALPPPHSDGQRELIETPKSVALFGGARYGKTEAGVRRIIRASIKDPGLYWWIGLTWQSASMKKAWRMVSGYWRDAFRQAGLDPSRYINKSSHEIDIPGGSLIMFRSAKNPDSIAGDGPKGVVGDEFPYWHEEVWPRFVYPATVDHKAWTFMMGRPAGENWGSQLWRDAATWDDWLQRHYTCWDNPLTDREWLKNLRDRTRDLVWDQEYMAEIGTGDSGLIPLHLVMKANERWKSMTEAERRTGKLVVGADISEGGGDLTTLAIRYGDCIAEIEDATPSKRGDMMPIADRIETIIDGGDGYAVVDNVGVGAMLPSVLRKRGVTTLGFKAGRRTKLRDSEGQFSFVDLRSAAWWHLYVRLRDDEVALPPDPKLTAELTAPKYETRAGAKIDVESKERVRKRIGRSTDKADAVVQAFWDRTMIR